MVSVINYRGRASELGGSVNIIDRRRSTFSRCERPPLSSLVDNTFRRSYAVAKFSKSGVWDKVPKGSTLIFGIPEFLFNTV